MENQVEYQVVLKDHPAVVKARMAAVERSLRYGIPAYKLNDKLGVLWLVAGGPRNQTYWTPERIIKKAEEHEPSCTPAYLCDACIDDIINAVNEPDKDEIMKNIMDDAKERMQQIAIANREAMKK